MDIYAAKAKAVVIRHASGHQVIAVVEIVSPGNKSNRHGMRAFVEKAVDMLRAGVHLLIVDLFPPGPRDPQGIQKVIWDEFADNDFVLPAGKPFTVGAYIGGPCPEVFVQTTALGAALPKMALFLTPEDYLPAPLACFAHRVCADFTRQFTDLVGSRKPALGLRIFGMPRRSLVFADFGQGISIGNPRVALWNLGRVTRAEGDRLSARW